MAADDSSALYDRGDPDLGKTPEEIALWREIGQHASAGRQTERELAAWRLADLRMRRTLPGSQHELQRKEQNGKA